MGTERELVDLFFIVFMSSYAILLLILHFPLQISSLACSSLSNHFNILVLLTYSTSRRLSPKEVRL